MATTESKSSFPSTYWKGTTDQAEVERLDSVHQRIKAYLDGKSFLAPLDNPKHVLDIGAGSGIWAIDLAEKFPNAQMNAVDISPMVPRFRSLLDVNRSPVPPNLQFQQLDIMVDPSPWEPSSFDVVHAGLLLIHLPDPRRALERIAQLVKPGGWLLVEDLTVTGDVKGDAPAVRMAFGLLCEYLDSKGQVGENLGPWLRETGSFSEINMHEVILPMGNHVHRSSTAGATAAMVQDPVQVQEGQGTDHKRRALASAFAEATWRSFAGDKHHPRMIALGYTPELKSQCVEQFTTSEWRMDMPLHFVWARKSV